MKTDCVARTTPYETNKGKVIGAGLGATGGIAYIAHDSKPLLSYINKNLDKIKVSHPNTTGTYKDIFCSYLKKNTETGKQGIVFLKNKTQVAKRAGLIAGVVAAGAIAGTIIGAVVDKITESAVNKKQNIQK